MDKFSREQAIHCLNCFSSSATVVTLAGIAIPQLLAGLDDYRAAGAARYLSTRIQRTRMEAVKRSTAAAVQVCAG